MPESHYSINQRCHLPSGWDERQTKNDKNSNLHIEKSSHSSPLERHLWRMSAKKPAQNGQKKKKKRWDRNTEMLEIWPRCLGVTQRVDSIMTHHLKNDKRLMRSQVTYSVLWVFYIFRNSTHTRLPSASILSSYINNRCVSILLKRKNVIQKHNKSW